MVVFGSDNNQSVATLDRRREFRVFHLLACIIQFHWQPTDIDQLRLDICASACLLKYEMRDVLAS